jgi:uncharacterized protein
VRPITVSQLRRYVVACQGYVTRPRRGTAEDVVDTVRRLSCVQLDSISTVDRSHRITLGSRVGNYPRETVSRLLREGRIFEYWAHEACLLPIEDYGLHKWRMDQYRDSHPWFGNVVKRYPGLREQIIERIREEGPLGSRHFEGEGRGGMWNWKPAKEMLEALYSSGQLAIAGRSAFQRLYDLPERVIPRAQLEAPTPTDAEFKRGFALRAVHARGALTERGIAEHCRFRGGAAGVRPYVDGLEREGLVRRLAVEDGGAPVVVPAEAELDGSVPNGGVLISPFDNLVWDRDFLERVFGFRHVIEVYKRGHERIYGYYVLPFLFRDRLVGRVDLKTDRAASTLNVRAFHLEPGVKRTKALEEAFGRALARLARTIGVKTISV